MLCAFSHEIGIFAMIYNFSRLTFNDADITIKWFGKDMLATMPYDDIIRIEKTKFFHWYKITGINKSIYVQPSSNKKFSNMWHSKGFPVSTVKQFEENEA